MTETATLDERPGDYLEDRPETPIVRAALASRYASPTPSDLVTFWKRNGNAVLSVTADGKTTDYELSRTRVAQLGREALDFIEMN